jgi:hypothetical protein
LWLQPLIGPGDEQMKTSINSKWIKERLVWALGKIKIVLSSSVTKKALQASGLVLVVYISWNYTDIFKLPDDCYDARPDFNTTLYIKNPNMGWKEFKGLEMGGIIKTRANDGKDEIERSYDLISGKPADVARKFLLKGFINSYDLKVEGCIDSVTLFTRIHTLSGSKALLNEKPDGVELTKNFSKQELHAQRVKNRKCKVELVLNPIDPTATVSQIPSGKIHMTCR